MKQNDKEYKIEKGIPIPVKRAGPVPWTDMKVGDSVLLGQATARSAAYEAGKRLNMKFVTRSVEGGVRVWRVK